MVFSLWMVDDDANFLHWTFTFGWIRIFQLDLHHITDSAVLCGFNEGEGLGATLRGVEGPSVTGFWGLDGSSEVGWEESLLPCWGSNPHQPAFLLFLRIVILNNVDDFPDFKLEFVHILCLILVSGLYLVENPRWKVVSCGASWNVIWVTGSIGLWVAVRLRQVSHWFVVILRWGQASTVLLGASAAVSG